MDLPAICVNHCPCSFDVEVPTFSFILKEAVDLRDGSVEGNDVVTVISSVQDQVLAHHGQTDETKITTGSIMRL